MTGQKNVLRMSVREPVKSRAVARVSYENDQQFHVIHVNNPLAQSFTLLPKLFLHIIT
jgi:hypothetical protein